MVPVLASLSSTELLPLLAAGRAGLQLALLVGFIAVIQYHWPFEHAPVNQLRVLTVGSLVRACLVPAVFIGFGLSTIHRHGIFSSEELNADIQAHFSRFRTTVDNYFQFLPYLVLVALVLAGVKIRSDRLNVGWLVLKSEAIMLVIAFSLKYATNIDRPNGDYYAFPSGHTAQAFLAASLVHQELRHKSPWYGIGAYAIAITVAVLRLLNFKHWEADVLAGAGIGILAAHLAYFFHRTATWPGSRRGGAVVPLPDVGLPGGPL